MSKGAKKRPEHHTIGQFEQWAEIEQEMANSDHRTFAIVAVSFIENNLVTAIMTRLRVLGDEEQRKLFDEEHAALRNISAKIDIGYALNLYGENVREDLHRIRQIRNKFAHKLSVRSFDHPEVAKYCDKLIGPDLIDLPKGATKPRTRVDRFAEVTHHLADRFAKDAVAAPQRPELGLNKIGANY